MRPYRTLALGALTLVLVLSACSTGGGSSSPTASTAAKPTVIVGSAGFYESQLVAEIYAQALAAKGFTVERKLNLGTREATQPAIESGKINLMPEYIGSELKFLGGTPTGDAAATLTALQQALTAKGLTALDASPGQDQNGFVVRKETADKYSLKTMSDLSKVASQLKWGLPPECGTNKLCGDALKTSYGIDITKLQVQKLAACDAPIAQALNSAAIDVAELCTTQPAIQQFNFVLLTDDKHSQPADNLAPVLRKDLADAGGTTLAAALNAVSAKLTTDTLTAMGVKVAVNQEKASDVARKFLQDNGLI